MNFFWWLNGIGPSTPTWPVDCTFVAADGTHYSTQPMNAPLPTPTWLVRPGVDDVFPSRKFELSSSFSHERQDRVAFYYEVVE